MSGSIAESFTDDVEDAPQHTSMSLVLNGLLLILGAAVLGVAFYLLDTHDPRTLYNPWTYVVLVPITLVLISTILSTLVSRVVERSLQATFLMSVLVHLIILACAGNVVIFSRAWPDLFDSLAEERVRLKRQAVQAKQYVRISSRSETGQLPDYLRYLPSEHSPSPTAQTSQSPESHKSTHTHLLASPDSTIQPTESTHLMERTQPASVPAELTDDAGRMSRSSLAEQVWKNAYLGRIQPIEVPAEAAVEVDSQGDLEPSLAQDTQTRRAVSSPQLDAEPPADVAKDQTSLSASTAMDLAIQRRSPANQLPIPADRVLSQEFQRSTTAGGLTGPAARSSQPTLGIQSLAAPESQLESLRATAVPKRKNQTSVASSVPELLDPGVSRSPNWDALPSVTDGAVGRSPQQLAKDTIDGEAAVTDVAALTGSGRDIQRAALGLATPPIPKTPIEVADSPNTDAGSSPSGEDDNQPTQKNGVNGGTIGRSASAELLLQPADATAVRRTRSGQRSTDSSRSNQDRLMSEGGLANSVQAPLELDTTQEFGSLSAVASVTPSSLLAGRLRSAPETRLPSLDELQLQRSPVGGPLGPTANAAVAKPAFQQRLDRLNSLPNPEQAASGPQTELAIERGLEFLARYQRNDGSWRLQDFDTEVLIRSDTAATGLALLAFQGAGYTHLQSKYAKQIDRAIQFLASHQKQDGDLYIPQDPASDQNAWLYSHSIAALALCEAFGMTQDQRLRPVAQRAVDFMILAQDQRRGGWRYRPGTGADTSVTGWFMMALKSGHLAGLTIPQATFENLHEFLSNAQLGPAQPYLFRYNPYAPDTIEQRHGLRPTAVMTSVGLLMRLYLGWNRDQAEMQDGAKFLLEHFPQHGSASQTLRDTYYWYYATQVIFHVGGDYWQRWHEALYPLLVEHQELEGPYKGSWSPLKPVPDLWARYGGRLYVTTMNLLSLEVSYRHLPLYEATSPSGPGK